MKNKVITISVGEKEYRQISQRAEEANLSVGKYVLKSALADKQIALRKKQAIYGNLCVIKDYTQYGCDIEKIPEVCNAIWQLLG